MNILDAIVNAQEARLSSNSGHRSGLLPTRRLRRFPR
jgi:hypothetical protein